MIKVQAILARYSEDKLGRPVGMLRPLTGDTSKEMGVSGLRPKTNKIGDVGTWLLSLGDLKIGDQSTATFIPSFAGKPGFVELTEQEAEVYLESCNVSEDEAGKLFGHGNPRLAPTAAQRAADMEVRRENIRAQSQAEKSVSLAGFVPPVLAGSTPKPAVSVETPA